MIESADSNYYYDDGVFSCIYLSYQVTKYIFSNYRKVECVSLPPPSPLVCLPPSLPPSLTLDGFLSWSILFF